MAHEQVFEVGAHRVETYHPGFSHPELFDQAVVILAGDAHPRRTAGDVVGLEWRLKIDLPEVMDYSVALKTFAFLFASEASHYFNYLDLAFCIVFQFDFFLRWAFAGWGLSYFLRHFFFESLPAFPYGFLFTHMGVMEEARAVIVVRLVRLRRILTLRALILVSLRLFRVIAFFSRGMDRAVEKFRPVFDRDVMIFEPQPVADAPESPLRRRALDLENRRQRFLKNYYGDVPWNERGDLFQRHLIFHHDVRSGIDS